MKYFIDQNGIIKIVLDGGIAPNLKNKYVINENTIEIFDESNNIIHIATLTDSKNDIEQLLYLFFENKARDMKPLDEKLNVLISENILDLF